MTYPDSTSSKSNGLQVITAGRAVQLAKQEVDSNRTDDQPVLKTRWPNVNEALMGGLRFDNNILLAGLSGHGKSFFLNLIIQDMLNPQLNSGFKEPFLILHFNFEMSGADEILRSTSTTTGLSYGDLLSAKRKLTDPEYDKAMESMNKLKHPNLFFSEVAGNRHEIRDTIYGMHSKFPDHRIVVTLDHTLLVQEYDEGGEVEKLAALGKMFIQLKKELKLLTILVGQLNDKIEDTERRNAAKPGLHYPIKTDVFGSKQIYHAVDTVIVVHRPELLYLEFYGPKGIPTKDLMAVHFLKMRKGQIGLCKLKQNFQKGLIEKWEDPKLTYEL